YDADTQTLSGIWCAGTGSPSGDDDDDDDDDKEEEEEETEAATADLKSVWNRSKRKVPRWPRHRVSIYRQVRAPARSTGVAIVFKFAGNCRHLFHTGRPYGSINFAASKVGT
ncbi:hypothetical protein K0M31_011976, partial [Melipona bicolor]